MEPPRDVFCELWDLAVKTDDHFLCGYLANWIKPEVGLRKGDEWTLLNLGELEFHRGCLWTLLDLNVSNLKDAFDYKFTDRVWLPRAVNRTKYHVHNLRGSAPEKKNWLDQWASVVCDHLNNVTATWMHELFSDGDSSSSDEEDNIDGPQPWPPAPVHPEAWFVSTVAAFGILETAFEGMDSIFELRGLEKDNQVFQNFQRDNINRPRAAMRKMRELLVSAPSLNREHSKLAWCIFARIFLNSALNLQSLVLYTQ